MVTEATSPASDEELKDCPVDEAGDLEDPNNLFTCKVSEECCTVDLKPACCASKEMKDEMYVRPANSLRAKASLRFSNRKVFEEKEWPHWKFGEHFLGSTTSRIGCV